MMDTDDQVDLVEDGPRFKQGNNKMMILLCVLLWMVPMAILIGVVVWAVTGKTESNDINGANDTCTTRHCVITAGKILEKLDTTIDPCDNFFEYACGGWLQKSVIPEDKTSIGTFDELQDEVEVVLKGLLEATKSTDDSAAIKKAKDLYASCLDLDTIDARQAQPLIDLLIYLQGWPVLYPHEGGFWNEGDYTFEHLAGQLIGEFDMGVVVSAGVTTDDKNSSLHVLYVDEPYLGMTREHFLDDEYSDLKKAYFDYMVTITTLLGADEENATKDMTDVLEFETKLARITTPSDQRRNQTALYNPTTIGDLQAEVPPELEFNWMNYFNKLMPEDLTPLNETEVVINYSPDYITEAVKITINETPKRVVANYLIWLMVLGKVSSLSKEFRDARHEYYSIVYGTSSVPARWRTCVSIVDSRLSYASGRMYVDEKFAGDSKQHIIQLVGKLKTAFKGMLEDNDWMDEETKDVAREKCDAIQERVGYPDWVKDDDALDAHYKEVEIDVEKYFETYTDYIKWVAQSDLGELQEPVNKTKWDTGPAVVNAYYSPSGNHITFPAGILQPPFFHVDSPWYLNYGGIGAVIGHEITHGFDDQGRQFDKDGNLRHWWTDNSIAKFEERDKCIIDQYSNYVVPEVNKHLNGNQTQGENIADNGGLKESFKAYKDNEYSDMKLPGLETYSPEQLLFLSFAQVWCGAYRPEAMDDLILTNPHSPGRFRVIGTLSNSFDFAKAYNCPADSKMNPPAEEKCVIW